MKQSKRNDSEKDHGKSNLVILTLSLQNVKLAVERQLQEFLYLEINSDILKMTMTTRKMMIGRD